MPTGPDPELYHYADALGREEKRIAYSVMPLPAKNR